MKIAYFTNVYPHVRHTFIRREILALEQLGVEVERFSVRRSDSLPDEADRAELQKTRTLLDRGKFGLMWALLATLVTRPLRWFGALGLATRLGRGSHVGLLKHFAYLAEACVLRKWLEECGANHVHVHFATNPAAVAMLCERLGGPSFSVTIHGPEEWDRPEAISLREKYEAAKFVVAVSHFGKCQVFRWCSYPHWAKVHVVRCGVDASFLEREIVPVPEAPRLALVGALVEQKGHLILIEALSRLKDWGVPFEVAFVGDGHLRPIVEGQIAARGLSDSVTLAGWMSGSQVREQLLQSRALVMSSLAENLPVAMMEAMASGRPVIGTYVAGIPELIDDGETGYLVPASDVDGLAAAVRKLLGLTPEQTNEMGRRARERVAKQHDVLSEAAKLKALFAQSVNATLV